ncbi:hypothetical protein [Terrarubrum flagellatum]|uniref:hypothetical protein n=1 Tax=Terrirubrum flagellatum TaxID=2895980 RepID=UPI0031455E30
MRLLGALILAASLPFLPASARADCAIDAPLHFPEINDSVFWTAEVTQSSVCEHRFLEGRPYQLTSVTIRQRPEIGSLVKSGDAVFRYAPKYLFKGTDVYAFKVCARRGVQSGCSTVIITAHMK